MVLRILSPPSTTQFRLLLGHHPVELVRQFCGINNLPKGRGEFLRRDWLPIHQVSGCLDNVGPSNSTCDGEGELTLFVCQWRGVQFRPRRPSFKYDYVWFV